jgi:hypothetical protein
VIRLVAGLAALLGACSGSGSNIPPQDPRNLSEFLETVAAKCRLPRSTFQLKDAEQVYFQPPADARYEDVDCALRELKKSPFPLKLGFVGNEAFRED